METLKINPNKLYKGCILAAIVHAVTVGEYPELNYEHSWDGMNYCMNDSQGSRATITFHSEYIIAVFQDLSKIDKSKSAYDYFAGAPNNILKIANEEALQYVLENINGEIKPIITAAFWGTWETLSSNETWDNITENGGHILTNQLLDYEKSLVNWDDNYGLNTIRLDLIHSLFQRKTTNKNCTIHLTEQETSALYGDVEECRKSLRELNILF